VSNVDEGDPRCPIHGEDAIYLHININCKNPRALQKSAGPFNFVALPLYLFLQSGRYLEQIQIDCSSLENFIL